MSPPEITFATLASHLGEEIGRQIGWRLTGTG